MGRLRVAVCMVLLAGCFHSSSEVCDNGLLCPEGSTCDVAHDRCISAASTAACDGLAEGSGCTLTGEPGTCIAGACSPFFCGDGSADADEACDGSDLDHKSCRDFGFYGSAGLACSPTCMFDLTQCYATEAYCGDGVVNGQELCDGSTDLTCVDIGFDAGALACTQSCGLTVETCSHFGWNAEPIATLVAYAVAASGPLDQWAVGASGGAQHFDGFWRADAPPAISNDLVGVSMTGPDDAWVVGLPLSQGSASVLLHHDPLAGWATVAGPDGVYADIYAADGSDVFIAADLGVFASRGSAWTPLAGLPGKAIAIRGTSPTDLWVATDAGDGTGNGPLEHWDGAQWTAAPIADAALHFISTSAPDDVWVIGNEVSDVETGVIAHWNGAQWTDWRTAEEFYNNIASSGPHDAWVAVSDDTMLHFDGTGWLHTSPIGASPTGLAAISGIVAIDGDEVVAVSTLDLAYRYDGQAFGGFPTLPNFQLPNPRVQTGIWGDSSTNQYVTNVLGEIVHWDGTQWTTVFTIDPLVAGDSVSATAVWGAGGSDVWVSTSDGRVLHATDGATFVDTDLGETLAVDALWGSGPDDVWAFGVFGVFRFAGGAWTQVGDPTARVLSASGSGPTDVWEVTAEPGGTLRHCDGASCMAVMGVPSNQPLNAVIAIGADTTFVAAGHGHILHRAGGTTWATDTVAAKAELQFFAASGGTDVTVASDEEMFHWDGFGWSPLRTPVDFVPNTSNFIPIAGLQASTGRLDLLLQTSRVSSLLVTRPITCLAAGSDACGDGVDNDCDGVVDNNCP